MKKQPGGECERGIDQEPGSPLLKAVCMHSPSQLIILIVNTQGYYLIVVQGNPTRIVKDTAGAFKETPVIGV
jgi:hypothetical protein